MVRLLGFRRVAMAGHVSQYRMHRVSCLVQRGSGSSVPNRAPTLRWCLVATWILDGAASSLIDGYLRNAIILRAPLVSLVILRSNIGFEPQEAISRLLTEMGVYNRPLADIRSS